MMHGKQHDGTQKSWNLGKSYFDTIGDLVRVIVFERKTKNISGWFESLRAIFNLVAPFCWKTQTEEEYVTMEKKLETLSNAVYSIKGKNTALVGVELTKLFDQLASFERRLLWKMHQEQVLAPLYATPDSYNNP